MRRTRSDAMSKAVIAGMLSGLLVFLALKAAVAFQQVFTVAQVASDPGKFYGRQVSVAGLIRGSRIYEKYMGRGEKLRVMSFSLYEPSGEAKYPFGRHYISVDVPAVQFRFMPNDGDSFTVSGVLKDPSMIGSIEP